jgi:hypothetical protein
MPGPSPDTAPAEKNPASLWTRVGEKIKNKAKVMSHVDTAYPSFNFPRLAANVASLINWLKNPSAHFSQASADALLLPFAMSIALFGLITSTIKLTQAENKKDIGIIGNILLTTAKFLLSAIGLIGSLAAGALFGVAAPALLTAGAGLSALYNLGLTTVNAGLYVWAKANNAEASAEKYKENAKHYGINSALSSVICIATAFLTLTKIAPIVFTVAGAVTGFGGMVYCQWKASKEINNNKKNSELSASEKTTEQENVTTPEHDKSLRSTTKLVRPSFNNSTRLLSQVLSANEINNPATPKNDSSFTKWDYYENKNHAGAIDNISEPRDQQIYLIHEAVTRFNALQIEPPSKQRSAEMSMMVMLLKTLAIETEAIPPQIRSHSAFKKCPPDFSALLENTEYKKHAKDAAQSWKKIPESQDLQSAFAKHAVKQKENLEKTELAEPSPPLRSIRR